MNILFIGDIFARPGRQIIQEAIPLITERHDVDLVIANVENAAAGAGVTPEVGEAILASGVHVMTSGNHLWSKKEVFDYIQAEPRLLRPANHPPGVAGHGAYLARAAGGASVGVVNIMGRVFMHPLDDPFRVVREEIDRMRAETRIIVVDFHAEATSEKVAMGWYLDGLVTAVVGTHTHVQTADEHILPKGTAYISDVGMTGAHDGVIGLEKEAILARFLSGVPTRAEPAKGGVKLNAVLVSADPVTGRAQTIERFNCTAEDLQRLGYRKVETT